MKYEDSPIAGYICDLLAAIDYLEDEGRNIMCMGQFEHDILPWQLDVRDCIGITDFSLGLTGFTAALNALRIRRAQILICREIIRDAIEAGRY